MTDLYDKIRSNCDEINKRVISESIKIYVLYLNKLREFFDNFFSLSAPPSDLIIGSTKVEIPQPDLLDFPVDVVFADHILNKLSIQLSDTYSPFNITIKNTKTLKPVIINTFGASIFIDKKIKIDSTSTQYEFLYHVIITTHTNLLDNVKDKLNSLKPQILESLEKSFTVENMPLCLSKYDFFDIKLFIPISNSFSLSPTNESALISMLLKGTEDWKNKMRNVPLEDLKIDIHICFEFNKGEKPDDRYLRMHVKCTHIFAPSKESLFMNDEEDE